MTKPLVIYHADCTDGYGAAFAAWLKLGDEAEYVPMNYGAKFDNGLSHSSPTNLISLGVSEREVFILDFSLPRESMDWLFANAKRVVWLDHHATAFKEHGFTINGPGEPAVTPLTKHDVILDNNKSGALLAWEYFHPDTKVPMLIQHIDDRDRWQWKLEGSAELHAFLSSMRPWSFKQWRDLDLLMDEMLGVHRIAGTAILRAQKQHVEQMAKQARKCHISGDHSFLAEHECVKSMIGLAVNASIHQSEVGHELANKSGTYGLVWYLGEDNRVRCSLRSNGDYDVSAIARAFGGGGHRNAAGFSIDIETLMGWLG